MTEVPQIIKNIDIFSPEFLQQNYRNYLRAIQKLRPDIDWNSKENKEKLRVVRENLQKLPLFHRSAVTNYHSHPSPSIALQEAGVLSYARLNTFQRSFFKTTTLVEDVVAKREDFVFLSFGKPYVASAYDTADEFFWLVCDTATVFSKKGVVVQDASVSKKLGLYTMDIPSEELLPETEILEIFDEGVDEYEEEDGDFADMVERLSNKGNYEDGENFIDDEIDDDFDDDFDDEIDQELAEENDYIVNTITDFDDDDDDEFANQIASLSDDEYTSSQRLAEIEALNNTSLTGEKYLNILALAIVADIITPKDIRSEVMIPTKLEYKNISLILETYSSNHDYRSTKAIEYITILKSVADIDFALQRQDGYVSEVRVSPLLVESLAPSLHDLTTKDLLDSELEIWYKRAAQKVIQTRGLASIDKAA